ncbi:MAG: extracellular solute-binding protein [Anaerolineae bacterium]|nr:extracellular solute-binding protein [Anaerolineae bacterium]
MDGRQSMVIGGPWATAAWRENSPEVYENYVVCPHPRFDPSNPKSFIHTYALAVSAGSQHPTEAWHFLNYLLSDPGDMLQQAGYINGRVGWLDTPQAAEYRGLDRMRTDYENGAFVWRSLTFTQEGEAIKNAIPKPLCRMATSRLRWTRRPQRSTRHAGSSHTAVAQSIRGVPAWELLLSLLRPCARPIGSAFGIRLASAVGLSCPAGGLLPGTLQPLPHAQCALLELHALRPNKAPERIDWATTSRS